MVRLAVLATQTMSAKALESVEELFGSENVEALVIS
jgi:DNA helicase-2/ATP-dependent DNA helicase PcrA